MLYIPSEITAMELFQTMCDAAATRPTYLKICELLAGTLSLTDPLRRDPEFIQRCGWAEKTLNTFKRVYGDQHDCPECEIVWDWHELIIRLSDSGDALVFCPHCHQVINDFGLSEVQWLEGNMPEERD